MANYQSSDSGFQMTETDKQFLLQEARASIMGLFSKEAEEGEEASVEGWVNVSECSRSIKAHCGAFVTLTRWGRLRGCMGMMMSDEPLLNTVREMAVAAAVEDPRFPRLSLKEMEEVEIEISVLSPLKKIEHASEIVLGKHGIYLVKGRSSGVYLPQVATEAGWDVEQFLGHCAREKARIGWDGWKSADIYIFTSTVFSEESFL
ncbi:MAG: AmmeMemoRadiSam system protein A [Bacteroidota bacterium]|nr:AmmeMemoRadiSam system protein A [Bacteroidota bacterium]